MEILIVSGMSGAGKSQAANILEDLGFYTVDNMPPGLLKMLAEFCIASGGRYERVALVIDIRAGETFDELFSAVEYIRSLGGNVRILFLEADTEAVLRRYKETRRRHPLSKGEESAEAVISREREMLRPVRESADHVVDTTRMRERDLKERLVALFSVEKAESGMLVTVLSFGFKYGVPAEADLVFDLRFLPNPFYVEGLREKTGLDAEVHRYIFGFSEASDFLSRLYPLIDFLLPQYVEEGKGALTIGVGCTGGRHRSTALAREIHLHIKEQGFFSNLVHRDIGK